MDNNIIDYGKISIPTSWDEITLKQFSDIERYYADKEKQFDAREVLHIFTNKTIDEINNRFGKSLIKPASLKIIGESRSKNSYK